MLDKFILTKIEELGKEMNDEIVYLCISQSYYTGQVKGMKENINDFRSCWKAVKSGHDMRQMLTILSARIAKTNDPMKMKEKVVKLVDYVDNYDEFKGEELANIPWESIKLWS